MVLQTGSFQGGDGNAIMIEGKRVVAVITARGGSKGLPGKNIRLLAGRPLLAWTIEAAQRSRWIDRLILSSDNDAIIAAAIAAGCEVPFVRPAALSEDSASSADVLAHALDMCGDGYDLAVLLQPTSPMRATEDIDACIRLCAEGASSAISVCESDHPPHWMYYRGADGALLPVLELPPGAVRRQDLPATYRVNGAVYVVDIPWFRQSHVFVDKDTRSYVMPRERSVDIDTLTDFRFAELLADQPQPQGG